MEVKRSRFGAGGVAQVIECLPIKCKTLSSNPNIAKVGKKKKKKKKRDPAFSPPFSGIN
jgi:hypothetical protein